MVAATATAYAATPAGLVASDEGHEAHFPAPVARAHDFDDEVVPALRKRLEEESRRLASRMSRLDSSTQYTAEKHDDGLGAPSSSMMVGEAMWTDAPSDFSPGVGASRSLRPPTAGLPSRRTSEILQDGLGSDELIPSEWATGSSARFRSPANTIGASAGGSGSYRGAATHEKYYTISPSSSFTSFPQRVSPTNLAPSGQDSVAIARERARRLASQKPSHQGASASGKINGDDVFYFNEDIARARGERIEDDAFLDAQGHEEDVYGDSEGHPSGDEKHWQGRGGGRQRTSSTPAQSQQQLGKRKLQDHRKPATGANERLDKPRSTSISGGRTTPSKIPLPVSGSMAKYHPEYAGQIRRSKSGPLLSTFDTVSGEEGEEPLQLPTTPPHQDGNIMANDKSHNDGSPKNASSLAVHKKKKTARDQRRSASEKVPKRSATQTLRNSPPTQDVLDEFGPLGGVPRSMRNRDTRAEGRHGEGAARETQNPWDEEILPVVAKRLAQEKMLDGDPRLSRVEGLIDTWDRDGNPLSKSMLVLKQRAREQKEAAAAAAAAASQDEAEGDRAAVGIALSSNDADSNKNKRTSRLPIQAQQQRGSYRNKEDGPDTFEMTNARQQEQVITSASQKHQQAQQNKANSKQDDEGAGCCKCTIM